MGERVKVYLNFDLSRLEYRYFDSGGIDIDLFYSCASGSRFSKIHIPFTNFAKEKSIFVNFPIASVEVLKVFPNLITYLSNNSLLASIQSEKEFTSDFRSTK